jgi:serine/threonine protein kinase/tetratricopeptide (TPR) repeat protein
MIGTKLAHYEITSHLGTGGMGEVYQAMDSKLGRSVAVKFLPESLVHDAEFIARFEREARVLAALNHPNIAAIYGLENAGGKRFLVMELVTGETLAERIRRGPIAAEEALRIAQEIARALAAAHEQGIIHRDLKPANVKIRPDGTVKLLDFGIAKLSDSQNSKGGEMPTLDFARTGAILGTAGYMSPEQALGESTDARSDIFSLGVVLYEMLSGRRAFDGPSLLDTLNAVVRSEPSSLDSPATEIIKRCLAKQRLQRFQTMNDLTAALQQVQFKKQPQESTPSIAVLPFANMSRDADDEYFSDGLAEEIINALAQMAGVKVIARTSAFAFKGKNEDIRKIAEILGVNTILEGSVRRAGSRIRVTAQLIQASDGTHLWSQRYDRELIDIFAVQDEISAAIAEALKLKLAPVPQRRMPSLPAYEAYLQYRAYQWRFTPEASQRSREYLEQALAIDPGFALPYVGLADYHLALTAIGAIPSQVAVPKIRELAQQALAIDPELPEGHAMLGIAAAHYDFDFNEAERRFRLAMANKVITPHLRQWYASFLLFSMGRAAEALPQLKQTIEEDPLCQMWHYMISVVLFGLGSYDEAIAEAEKSVEIDPQFWLGWQSLGQYYSIRGRHSDALQCAQKSIAAAPACPYNIGVMAATLMNEGQAANAEPFLSSLRNDSYGGPIGLTSFSLLRGEIDNAVEYAGKSLDQRFLGTINLVLRPHQIMLRQSPAWPGLLKKMNLAQ